ncbi:MAG: hypothetical protein ACI4SR_05975 [Faecalibacillus sp.]
MKRFIFLTIYTAGIIGGSYMYLNNPMLPTLLYILLALLGIGICGILLPGISGMNLGGSHYGRADLNYIKAQEQTNSSNETKSKLSDIDFISVLTVIYLFVPILIAIFIFC